MSQYKPVVRSRRSWKPDYRENDVYYRTAVHSSQRDGTREIVMIRMGREVMKTLGWKAGDKASIYQADDDPLKLCVKLESKMGYTIHPAIVTENSPYGEQMGKSVRSHLVGTIDDNTPIPRTSNTTIEILDWKVEDGKLILRIPRDDRQITKWLSDIGILKSS